MLPAMRPLAAALSLATAPLLGLVAVSCLLVDPPPDVPLPQSRRPTLLRAEAVPPPSAVLTTLPRQFVVPVEVVDRNVSFEWRVFVDYDVLEGAQVAYETGGVSDPESNADAGNLAVRLVAFSVRSDRFSGSFLRCHTIEIVVAERFVGDRDRVYPSGEGDAVSWFYNPAGDLAGCPTFDAGADGGPDADADAEGG